MLYFVYGRTQGKKPRERHRPLDHHCCAGRSRDLLVPEAEVKFPSETTSAAQIVVCASHPASFQLPREMPDLPSNQETFFPQ
jgi:hypothetical protein